MKKKIPRVLGVGLSFILLVSLMAMATPASAGTLYWGAESNIPKVADEFLAPAGTSIVDLAVNGDVIYAATGTARMATLTQNGHGLASWTDSSSVKLIGGDQTGDDYAAMVITMDGTMKLSEVTEFIYNFYIGEAAGTGPPHMCFYVHDPLNTSNTADISTYTSGSIAYSAGVNTINVGDIVASGSSGLFWVGDTPEVETGLSEGLSNTYTLAQFQADAAFKDYVIDRIQIEYGWWSGGDASDPVYVHDVSLNGNALVDSILYKSTDAGKTWTSLDTTTYYPTSKIIEQVAVAPDDADILAISTSDNYIYYSSSGGSSWSNMQSPTGCKDIFDIDVSPGTSKKVAVAGQNTDGDGEAELFTLSLAIAATWYAESAEDGFRDNQDYLKAVKFSPHYTIDKLITVVSGSDTEAHFQVFRVESGANAWNGEIAFFADADWGSDADGGVAVGSLTDEVITGGLTAASIALEPEYLGTDEESRIAFVSIAAGTGGGVLRLTDAYMKKFTTWSAGEEGDIGSVAYHEAGKLLAGDYDGPRVYYTTNPMATTPKFERLNALKQPGGADKVSVGWSGDTAVAGTEGDESAFAVSTDDGYSWNDISMIDTRMTVIDDVAVSADGSVIYLSTHDGTDTSIWRKGSDWTRIFTTDEGTTDKAAFLVRIAPDDADAVYISSKTTLNMWVSNDGGSTKWKHIPAYKLDTLVKDFEVESADVVFAIDADECSKTTNAGQSWGTAAGLDGITDAYSITVAPNGDVLIGGETGKVAFSKDGGSSFTRITDTLTDAEPVHIVVDDDYADNNKIYIGGGNEVERGTASKTTSWSSKEPTFPSNHVVKGMAQIDDVVYVLTANISDSRLYRALELETGATAALCLWSYIEGADEVYNLEPRALKMSSGPKFWAIDTVSPALESIVDPIAVTGPTLKSPADAFSVPVNIESGEAYNVTFIWERYSSTYIVACQLQIATDTAFDGIVFDEQFTGITADIIAKVIGPSAPSGQTAQFNPGETYYWRVRVSETGPMYSAWSATRSFRIESPVAFGLISPALGATNVPIAPTLTWDEFEGAISYEVMLAEDPTFAVFDWIRSADATYYKVMEPLNYATTYYWRVRGITGAPPKAGKAAPGGPWVSGLFTTAAEPVEPAPPIVIEPTPPAPPAEVTVVKVPQPSAIPPWMLLTIIGLGAVLFIALIVLIVRTRRVA